MTHKRLLSIRKASILILVTLALVIILFLIVEGLSSTINIVNTAFFSDLIAERQHTRYDEEIGWINLPNLSLNDMYGGKSFITNSMAFRNDKEFTFSVPSNKIRVICSGDSFTMGYGVDNDNTWCKLLESIDSRIESVNLGQGGYGVDQAYLWYKRNSFKLEHNIHIFAFMDADFKRMESDAFQGYGKSFFVLQDGVLININKPVPKRSYNMPRLPRIGQALRQSQSITFLKRILSADAPSIVLDNNNKHTNPTREIVVNIFTSLKEISKANNSEVVFVFLPRQSDYMGRATSETWRKFLHSVAIQHEFVVIDLIDEFRTYPPQEVRSLFAGHYSEKGNLYIANTIYEKLLSIQKIAYRFEQK